MGDEADKKSTGSEDPFQAVKDKLEAGSVELKKDVEGKLSK